jgi:hypothetical protein
MIIEQFTGVTLMNFSAKMDLSMRNCLGIVSMVVQRCTSTGLLVGYVPGFPGADRQAETFEELQSILHGRNSLCQHEL